MNSDPCDELLTPATVAKIIHRAPNWLAKARITGAGPRFLKIGRRVLYRRSDLDAWLAKCERRSTAERAA